MNDTTKAYLVGGGIASLASAAYLIRDGGVAGANISIFEQTEIMGGSLDGEGCRDQNYVIRGGRMFTEEAYTCMFDLLSFIPSLSTPGMSVKEEIYDFNNMVRSDSHCRLVREGKKVDASQLGLSNHDRLNLIEIIAGGEESLGAKRIDEVFQPTFFTTNFWYMWCTTFAFQTWHSAAELRRYLLRFIQEFPRIHTLAGVRRTPYNQYDSIVRPLSKWLQDQGVHFVMGAEVTGLDFQWQLSGMGVQGIRYSNGGTENKAAVEPGDLVFVTNGSMTAGSTLGSMTSSAGLGSKGEGGSWKLWETLSNTDPSFGRPEAFDGNVAQSLWLSFTATMRDRTFFRLMEEFTGNKAGTGGLVTFLDSPWLMSVVLPYQPHFINQEEGVEVFWGYGLFPDREGSFVKKKMSDCSGEEILIELGHHLHFDDRMPQILTNANCIPCMMPFITSQFMPRDKGDRPQVRPTETTNLAFIGQYCEMPDDVVFTVEYSVRSAQTAVYSLLKLDKEVSPLYKGQQDVGVLLDSLKTMFH